MKKLECILKDDGVVKLEAYGEPDPSRLIDSLVTTDIHKALDFMFLIHSRDYVYVMQSK